MKFERMLNFSFKCIVMIKSDNKIYQDMVRMMGVPGKDLLALKDAFGGTTKGQDDQGEVGSFKILFNQKSWSVCLSTSP